MPPVKIVEVARVAVPGTAALPPEPLLRLSALDAQWLTLPLIQRVLLFDGSGGRLPPFASVVGSLRASLAATLARFLPLAGKIVFIPSSGDAAIDCSEEGLAGGVRFVVAESDADTGKLARDEVHDVEALARLVPELDAGELPAETMAAQVTRLAGGGLAVGVALHHSVVDGRSVWRFLEAWAAACSGDTGTTAVQPTFDRTAIALPGGEELARSTLRKYAPDLPVVRSMNFMELLEGCSTVELGCDYPPMPLVTHKSGYSHQNLNFVDLELLYKLNTPWWDPRSTVELLHGGAAALDPRFQWWSSSK